MSAGPRTLLVFVEDPGAANGVVGLAPRLAEKGISAHLVATGVAATFLAARGERFEPLAPGATAGELFERTNASALFVGTAESPDTFAFALVDEAKRRGLPTAGFIDAVSCADHRWRGRTEDPLAHCPDQLLVCDAETEQVFVDLGVPGARVHVCGHPQFDAILARGAELAREDRDALRRRLLPDLGKPGSGAGDRRRVVVFCAERSTGGFDDPAFDAQFRRSADYTLHGRGLRDTRTEIVIEELMDALKSLPERVFSVLRYHPKNIASDFGPLGAEFDATSIGGSAVDLLYASDLVVGMSSMVLLEAALLGRPTLSINTRPAERDWLPALARTTTPCVRTREGLRRFLAEWAASPLGSVAPPAKTGAIERLAGFLAAMTQSP